MVRELTEGREEMRCYTYLGGWGRDWGERDREGLEGMDMYTVGYSI